MIAVKCNHCKQILEIPDHYEGKEFRCTSCKRSSRATLLSDSSRSSSSSVRGASQLRQVVSNTDHLPYCVHCKTFVEPQVVGATEVIGGRTLVAPNGLGLTQVNSYTTYRKFCRVCGTEVFSKLDLNEIEAAKRNEKRRTVRTLLTGLIIIVVMFVALFIFMALYNR